MIRDLVATTLHRYKADVSDHVAKAAVLEKAVDNLSKKEKEAAESRDKGAQSGIDWLGKLGLAYDGATKLIGFAMSSLEQTSNRMRLELAAGTISVDALSKAAGGTISRMQLLDIAAKTQAGTFKLNQGQIETVVEAMRELTREGFKQEDVTKKVTDAIVKLDGEGLKELGIRVKQTSTDSEKFAEIMDKLTGKSRALGSGSLTAAEEMQQTSVSMTDAFATMRTELGKLVVAMSPLLGALASAVGIVASIVATVSDKKKLGDFLQGDHGQFNWHNMMRGSLGQLGFSEDTIDNPAFAAALGPVGVDAMGAYTRTASETRGLRERAEGVTIQMPGMDMRRKKGGGGPSGPSSFDWFAGLGDQISMGISDALREKDAVVARSEIERDSSATFVDNLKTIGGESLDEWREFFSSSADSWERMLSSSGTREPTLLERMFGTKEEFDGYKIGWDLLTGSITSGYNAMVDGTMSAGAAVKKTMAEAFKALGGKFLLRGLEEEAEAIVSLDPRHALAGAAFLAAAGVAGVLAHELGGSGAGASGGGGRSAGIPGGAPSGGDSGPRTIVYAIGSTDPDETPRMQQRRAARYIAKGLGEAGYGVSYS